METIRRFVDVFGQPIELTAERWGHVLAEHQELQPFESLIPETLRAPDAITRSAYDPQVRLYSKFFAHLWHGKYLVVVIKFNQRRFILTAYITDKVKGGIRLWPSD